MQLRTQQLLAMTFVTVLVSNSFLCSRYKRNDRMCSTGATEHELSANVPRWYLTVVCTAYDTGSAIWKSFRPVIRFSGEKYQSEMAVAVIISLVDSTKFTDQYIPQRW